MTSGKDAEPDLRKTREAKFFTIPEAVAITAAASAQHRALNCSVGLAECGALGRSKAVGDIDTPARSERIYC